MRQIGEKVALEVLAKNSGLIKTTIVQKIKKMTTAELYNIFKSCKGVSTDSRSIKGGELFFALKGENFDGNKYAVVALEAGAAYAVVEEDSETAKLKNDKIISVPNTLKALQDLARWHRSMTMVNGKPLTVIALTGTNGKTTTKELIREVLAKKYKVTATKGNLNNSIGVPLTLLRIDAETELAVVEMGASHPGDIKELVDIALPNYGLITNVGKAHLLGFGDFEGVMNTKGELYDYLRRTADKAFVNVDNPYLCKMAADRQLDSDPERQHSLIIPYGLKYQEAKVLASSSEHPYLRIELKTGKKINTQLIGTYNADNVLAALAIGEYFGVEQDDAVKAISAYMPENNRSQMLKTGKNTLIVDAYNANPTSMLAALDNFSNIEVGYKVAMLGDMLELGEDSFLEHAYIVKKVSEAGLNQAYFVGMEFQEAVDSLNSNYLCFETSEELAGYLQTKPLEGATILIKGSRGTKMENLLPAL